MKTLNEITGDLLPESKFSMGVQYSYLTFLNYRYSRGLVPIPMLLIHLKFIKHF